MNGNIPRRTCRVGFGRCSINGHVSYYVALRALTPQSDTPLWKLFAQAADAGSPPTAADLVVQGLGLTAGEAADALRYTTDLDPDFDPLDKPVLKTEEWPIRIWQSSQWQWRRSGGSSRDERPGGISQLGKACPRRRIAE